MKIVSDGVPRRRAGKGGVSKNKGLAASSGVLSRKFSGGTKIPSPFSRWKSRGQLLNSGFKPGRHGSARQELSNKTVPGFQMNVVFRPMPDLRNICATARKLPLVR
ncbi:hypothetical protein RB623_13775 [Mesorhizobium sp. LHD-90]|uniref:hypothetical protein n=1 Tax=Mesorhizobium sp. LHD-90 TaxID=3071414 RepID=UPI0027DFC024|nr:hypothetical protein [Mesorhizobium sp. LHD-90]MDQ6435121.1 hypothetical protein [Mesorhizobium sp. LHD-90]